jgi:hypothetical protein
LTFSSVSMNTVTVQKRETFDEKVEKARLQLRKGHVEFEKFIITIVSKKR